VGREKKRGIQETSILVQQGVIQRQGKKKNGFSKVFQKEKKKKKRKRQDGRVVQKTNSPEQRVGAEQTFMDRNSLGHR